MESAGMYAVASSDNKPVTGDNDRVRLRAFCGLYGGNRAVGNQPNS